MIDLLSGLSARHIGIITRSYYPRYPKLSGRFGCDRLSTQTNSGWHNSQPEITKDGG